MCLLFVYLNDSKVGKYKLIIASNRDEYYKRPTKSAGPWKNNPNVFGGLDQEPGREGGTWLAIGGGKGVIKCAALLNVTGESNPNTQGRGYLVSDYVCGELTNKDYTKKLLESSDRYNVFNFVSIGIEPTETNITFTSNSPKTHIKLPESDCLGIGNTPYDTPFEKVKFGREVFDKILKDRENIDQADLVGKLMELLKNEKKNLPDAELERRAPKVATYLSAIFVRVPAEFYGSRTHTVILIDQNNKMDLYEQTMTSLDPDGEWLKTHLKYDFNL